MTPDANAASASSATASSATASSATASSATASSATASSANASSANATSGTTRSWTPVVLPDLPPPAGAYSPGVRTANGLLFVSGQTPRNPATGQIEGTTVEEQTRVTLANLERILLAGGATLRDVVSVTVYLADEKDWGTFDTVYRTVFSAPFPTRAVVGASLRGILVEIAAVAVVSDAKPQGTT